MRNNGKNLIMLFAAYIIYVAQSLGLGHNVIREFPANNLTNSVVWDVDLYNDWAFFATEDGLAQFDGFRFELFNLNNRKAARSVTTDSLNQRIYIGGINEFGYFKPSTEHSLEYVCLSDSAGDQRFIGNIWGIYPQNGKLIVQGDNRILSYDETTGATEAIDSPYKLDCSAMIDGVLWLGTSDGLKFLMGRDLMEAPSSSILKGERIRKILPHGNRLIIVTANQIYDYDRQGMRSIHDDALWEKKGEIFTAALHEETLALGTVENGVTIIDLENGGIQIYNEETGLPSNTVLSLRFDNNGNLWNGLHFGISKILLTLPVERINNNLLPIGSGYAIAVKGDKMFLGTNRGLFSLDYIPGENIKEGSLHGIEGMRGQVWGLTKIGDELFCCHDRGLFVVDSDQPRTIGELSGVWDVQKLGSNQNRAYVGTYSGLYTIRKENGAWKEEKAVEGYPNSTYNFVQESPTVIWTHNGEEGINRLTIDTIAGKVTAVENFLTTSDNTPLTADVYIHRIDNDIIFTTPKGLYIYERQSGQITGEKELTEALGHPEGVKRLKKTLGSLYALTGHEVLQADPAGILDMVRITSPVTPLLFPAENGLLSPLEPHYIVIPSRDGFLFFDFSISGSPQSSSPPISRISRMAVTNSSDSTIFRGNFSGIKSEPNLKYKENSVRIEFGNPNELRKGVLYSTRINGRPWSKPSEALSKEYTNLREGTYLFEVKATGPDGSETTDTLTFRINPPWWRSPWAIIIYVLIGFAFLFSIVWVEHRRVVRKEKALLKEKDAEMEQRKAQFEWESRLKDHRIVQLEKEQLDKELRHKAQEMANAMMSISHKNDTLQTIKKELQTISAMLPKTLPDVKKALHTLQSKVNVDMRSDEILKKVEEEFDLANDNFMKKLRSNYPDLNNNEVLMCAYLKMNLSTKEMAPLLNISVRGVETMRYRLRKKLGLEREENLTEFLLKNNGPLSEA